MNLYTKFHCNNKKLLASKFVLTAFVYLIILFFYQDIYHPESNYSNLELGMTTSSYVISSISSSAKFHMQINYWELLYIYGGTQVLAVKCKSTLVDGTTIIPFTLCTNTSGVELLTSILCFSYNMVCIF